MRRAFLSLIGLLVIAGLAIPPLAALAEKRRRGEAPAFDPADDELEVATIFDSGDLASEARSFRGGEVLVWYAGLRLDLSRAAIDPSGAYLDVRCIFGGLDLVVPEGWPVQVRSRSIFGGVGDMTDQSDAVGPTLTIEAVSAFGGIAIRNPEGGSPDR